MKNTHIELWLGIVDALANTPFTTCRRRLGVCNWERYSNWVAQEGEMAPVWCRVLVAVRESSCMM